MKDWHATGHWMHEHPYAAFAINMTVSLAVMYLVMFSMIDGLDDFRNSLNMFYMALTMWRRWGASCWRRWGACILTGRPISFS